MNNSPVTGASNASDFQPSTQDPQAISAANLQTPATNVQPTSGDTSAEQLYQQADNQPGLKVQTDKYSTNSQVSVAPVLPRSNSGLITITSSALVLLLIVAIITRYWRQPLVTTEAEAVTETPEPTPVVAKAVQPTRQKNTKRQTAKKKNRKHR